MTASFKVQAARPIADLLAELQAAVDREPTRQLASHAALPGAARIARRLPLVHRTGRPRRPAWAQMLAQQALATEAVCTNYEKKLGYEQAVYFFLGCAAYPPGNVALLMDPSTDLGESSRFSPFDSGALEKHLNPVPLSARTPWDEEEKTRTLARYTGSAADLSAFAEVFLAGHFRDPYRYVTCPQAGQPDFSAYHELEDANQDRRAWSIEVRAHQVVQIPPDGKVLLQVVLEDRDLLEELPAAYLRHAMVPETVVEAPRDFTAAIAGQIVRLIAGGLS